MFSNKSKKLFVALIMAVFFLSFGFAIASSAGEHGETPSKGWVAEDTYRVMNFVLLASVLFFILRKPVSNALNGRIESIKKELEDLENKKINAEKKLAEHKEQIASFEKERESILANYQKQGEVARDRIIAEAKELSIKLETQAKKNIENEFKFAKEKLKSEITDSALLQAETIIKKSISQNDQNKLLSEYLNKVA